MAHLAPWKGSNNPPEEPAPSGPPDPDRSAFTPSGPPSPTGPPSGPPQVRPRGHHQDRHQQDPPTGPPVAEEEPASEEEPPVETQEESKEPESAVEDSEEAATEEDASVEEETPEAEAEPEEVAEEPQPESPPEEPEAEVEDEPEPTPSEEPQEESTPVEAPAEEPASEDPPAEEESPVDVDREMEIARLTAEIERLRGSLVGAAEVIEELEETPMPPVVLDNIVIPPHVVADFARMGRQLSRESLVKGTMGAISMLHPDEPGLMISTRHSTMLARLDERGIVGGRLGGNPPRGAIAEWKVHEVLLASVAMVTGGPAACIHMQGPYTTAASSEKDLILVQPIDVLGKEHIGKVVIVDPDDDAQEEFLRQVAEALQQGGMRCVVVRGFGAYAVGANLDQAMANAAMLEHSMQVLLLARQANLKI